MRKALAEENGNRKRFRAIMACLGKKTGYNGYSEETILLKNIVDLETNQKMTDHVWFSYTKGFQQAKISEGDAVEFDARIKEYKKGYVNTRYNIDHQKHDFKLSNPTKIKRVSLKSALNQQ